MDLRDRVEEAADSAKAAVSAVEEHAHARSDRGRAADVRPSREAARHAPIAPTKREPSKRRVKSSVSRRSTDALLILDGPGGYLALFMRLGSNRRSLLLAHGLQESEARVYLALIDHPSLTASTLAKAARVPRSYLYNVLQDLHARGLVEIILVAGKRSYRARPFDRFLAREAEKLKDKLSQLEGEMKTFGEALQPPPIEPTVVPEAGEVRLVIGRRAVAREIEELLHAARGLAAVECSQGGVERVGRHLQSLLESPLAVDGSLRVEVYLPPNTPREFLGGEVAASRRVVTRTMRTPSPVLVFFADDDRMLLVHPVPDSGELRQGRDFGILTNDPSFVVSRLQLLRDASEPDGER